MSVLTSFRHLFVPGPARPGTAPAALPQSSPSDRRLQSGGTFYRRLRQLRIAVMSPIPVTGVPVPEHDGSDDLDRWPASAAEIVLAAEWLRTGDPLTAAALQRITISEARAVAVGEAAYLRAKARESDVLLARAFGLEVD